MKNILRSLLFAIVILFQFSCDTVEEFKSDKAEMLALVLEVNGTSYSTTITGENISLDADLPYGTNEVKIKTLLISENAICSVEVSDTLRVSGNEFNIIVISEDESNTKTYHLSLTFAQNFQAELLDLVLEVNNIEYTTSITGVRILLDTALPYGTEKVTIKSFSISDSAICSLEIDDVVQVSHNDFIITVLSQDQSNQKSYHLIFSFDLNNKAELLDLVLEANGVSYATSIVGTNISLESELPYGTSEVRVNAIIISSDATSSISVQDIIPVSTSNYTISITAQDDSTQTDYYLFLPVTPNSEAELIDLSLEGGGIIYSTTITGTNISLNESLPYNTEEVEVHSLSISGDATCSISVGDIVSVTESDYIITILSQDENNQKEYNLFLPVTPSNEAELLSLIFEVSGVSYSTTVDGSSIIFENDLPYGTTSVKVKELIISNDATSSIANNDVIQLTENNLDITVTAQDQFHQKVYHLVFSYALNHEADLLSLVLEASGVSYSTTIVNSNILLDKELAYGTTEVKVKTFRLSDQAASSISYNDIVQVSENGFDIIITAQDQIGVNTYHLELPVTNEEHIETIMRPDSDEGKDAVFSYIVPNNNYGDIPNLIVYAWTQEGNLNISRTVIDFDYSEIPSEARIDSAFISLYFDRNSIYGSNHSGNNDFVIQRITSHWSEMEVTWNTKPTTTTNNQILISRSVSLYQDFIDIDVSKLTQDIFDNRNSSYGFMFRLQTEQPERRLLFASSDHSNAAIRPKLKVFYTIIH